MTNARRKTQTTRHARARCQQRGVPNETLASILEFGDRSVPVGKSCLALSLSKREARRLRLAGHPAAPLDRVKNLVVVVAPDGAIVTVLHAFDRRYRRKSN